MKLMEKLNVTRAERTAWAMNDVMDPVYMVTMMSELDATPIENLRTTARQRGGGHAPSYTAIIMKTVAMVMTKNPDANRAILGLPFFKKLFQFKNVDISVAVEKNLPYLPGLAYAPTIKNTLQKSLSEISNELQLLSKCDEANHAGYSQYMGILRRVPRPLSNILINLPYYLPFLWVKYRGCAAWVNAPSKAGADLVVTTWPWPLTFSFGIVKKRPLVVNDQIEARLTIPLVMVFDRRIMGGGPASRIFAQFQEMLSQADEIFESEFS